MRVPTRRSLLAITLLVGTMLGAAGCEAYPWLVFSDQTGVPRSGTLFPLGDPFTEDLVEARTYTNGTSVTTVTYAIGDANRLPLAIDFNGDGVVDPVVSYGDSQAVIQILLSRDSTDGADPIGLSLDSKRDMAQLSDVAVGDMDGDGYLDIVGGAQDAVWYFHHPSSGVTTNMRDWGNADPNDPLRERIDASTEEIDNTELLNMIIQAVGPQVNLDDYVVTVESLYTNVEVADIDGDGFNDVVTSRSFTIDMTPRPDAPVEPLQILDGDVAILRNPGAARDGNDWSFISVGSHERQLRTDRDGAAGLLVYDMDGDGLLDVVSSARRDNNVQVAWFRNPGGLLATENSWTQYRIGSIRDCWAIDVADVTSDGWPDVVATGGEQQQMVLFEHPGVAFPNDRFEYEWDSHVLATFESYEPRDLKVLDVDNDRELEIVMGGTAGAVRYFEPPADPRDEWTAYEVLTIDTGGDVGYLGYGDMDGDNDVDIVATVNATEGNDCRTIWIRNYLAQ